MMNYLDFFKEISKIPRGSGNEDGIRNFLLQWAKNNNIECDTDSIGNVYLYKPATKGMEKTPGVILQGHMDMVCVKTDESAHNFETDPIELVIEDGILHAKDTSLGADNGIALALTMQLFTDNTIKHGPLEAFFTISEETALVGAYNFDPKKLHYDLLINLDSEEEGELCIGCAGGVDLEANKTIDLVDVPDDYVGLEISLDGLKGGHSGMEIHLQRVNANKALARILWKIFSKYSMMLSCFNGGTRKNVIPFSAKAEICLPNIIKINVIEMINDEFNNIKNENLVEDPNINLSLKEVNCPKKAIYSEESLTIINTFHCVPHGVLTMSKTLKNVVETSSNFAIVETKNNKITVLTSQRSNVITSAIDLAHIMGTILGFADFDYTLEKPFPAWNPDPKNPLLSKCVTAWEDLYHKKPTATAIHAGVECELIMEKVPTIKSISLGPTIKDVHSVKERLPLDSCERTYKFLVHLLEIL